MSLINGPSANLTWQELACKNGKPYPEKFVKDGRVFQLAQLFEEIRGIFGDKPIVILSAYRTPEYNRKIGGARYSQHIEGRALDLAPPKGITIQKFYDRIRLHAEEFGIGGLARYPTFVHVDTRPRVHGRVAVWNGYRATTS